MCELKSNLTLKSNIILKTDSHKIGAYIPFELKPKEYNSVTATQYLTTKQKNEQMKKLFYAKEFIDAERAYWEEDENIQLCEGCPYKDRCV